MIEVIKREYVSIVDDCDLDQVLMFDQIFVFVQTFHIVVGVVWQLTNHDLVFIDVALHLLHVQCSYFELLRLGCRLKLMHPIFE